MSCNYFILTKPKNKEISNNEDNQIIFLNSSTFILPQNNIEYYIKHGLFENTLIEWCKQFCDKNKNILDIGAHTGTYTISLANNCKHVYSFEPQKMTYYALCGSVALSNLKNVTCYNIGLGCNDQVGIKKLHIISNDGGGSTLHYNTDNTTQTNVSTLLNTEDIEIKTLDSLNLENIGFIKMDVEDNELQVLQSALNTLHQSKYPKILFESNHHNKPLFDFLLNLNYDIIKINGYNNMFLATIR